MSVLNDLLLAVEKNLKSKQVEEKHILMVLEKIRQKYSTESVPPKERSVPIIPAEERILTWQEYYINHGDETGQWVFEPIEHDINDKLDYGRTLLHSAILEKNEVEIKQLVEKGINTKIKDNSGLTPFQVAIIEEDKEIISLLEELGITC